MDKLEQIKALYQKHAKEDAYSEDPMSDSGGNFDDAYSMGVDCGYSGLANEILKIIEEVK